MTTLAPAAVDPGGLVAAIEWRLLLIPPITGVIGYVTNWVAIRLLFNPVEFRGVDVPGMERVAGLLPYRLQQIPGVLEGKLGWQGIIPSRAGKMASISVDSGISKLASQQEFYEQFDPDAIAEHVLATAGDDVHRMVEEIIREENPELWADTPEPLRRLVHARVSRELPEITREVTHRIGENVDDLLDIKMMVIDHLEENPRLVNRIFLETGEREFEFLVNSGFVLGTLFGFVSIPLFVYVDAWWVLPAAGVFVGYATNWIALKAIFRPMHPHKVGPFTVQGIFVKRQAQAAETYATIVSEEVITLGNVARNLLEGPNADRTRRMIADAIRRTIDEAVGPTAPLLKLTTGEEEYEAIREEVAERGVDYTIEPMQDPEFNRERAVAIQELMASRMQALPPEEFAVMLRSAFEEDEWLLVAVGAALGFVAGWIQLVVVTAV